MQGRIWFEGNPWPAGHAVIESRFEILLHEGGVGLLLHLRSEDYDAHDDPDSGEYEEEAESAWQSKGVWGNYHACILSNTYWGVSADSAPKLVAPVPVQPASIALQADPVEFGAKSPLDDDAHAFHVYLLGHDSVHAHDIRITRNANGLYDLLWSGLIALSYVGSYSFRHRFRAEVRDVEFGGFRIERSDQSGKPKAAQLAPATREARARSLASRFIDNAGGLVLHAGVEAEPDYLKPALE